MNGMMLTTSPGLSGVEDLLGDVQKFSTGGALALGGALVMGVGVSIPGKFGWGFKLIGLAGMGYGAYKIYEAFKDTGKTDTGTVPPPNPETVRIIMSGGQATVVGEPGSTTAAIAAAAAGTKGGTGQYWQAAMQAKARYKAGYGTSGSDAAMAAAEKYKEQDLQTMRLWYDEIKYNTAWNSLPEFKEVKGILSDEGKIGLIENAAWMISEPGRVIASWFDIF